jgi:hypothetical protein
VGLDADDLDVYASQLEARIDELRAQKQKLFSLMKQVIQDEDERQLQRAQAAHPPTAPTGAAPPVASGHVYLQAGTGHARPPSPSSPRRPDVPSPQRGAPAAAAAAAAAAMSPTLPVPLPVVALASPWSLKRPADERPPHDHDVRARRVPEPRPISRGGGAHD